MAVETDTERLAMLNDFGVDVVISAVTYKGIYDRPYAAPGDMAGYAPELLMRTSDVTGSAVARGDGITIDGTSFTVREIQRDGTGFTTLVVAEA